MDSKRKDEIMNEAKIAVTIAALLITGAFGGYAFKNLDTDDIVTDKITTVETVKEVTPEEDMTEVETVELTDTAEDTQAKEIYLERSQSSIRSTVVHIEYDDCVYADEEPADEVQTIVEYETEPQASQAEVNDNESKAQASVEEDSKASQDSEADDISIRYDYFNADVTDTSSDDSSEEEDDSSFGEASDTESSSEEESSEDEELAEDKDSFADSEDSEEEDIAESFGESESTESTEEFVEDKNGELTESEEEAPEEEAPEEEENSAEDEESSESEEASESEESAEEDQTEAETSTGITVTQSEYYMLCNVVAHEYGSDWVSEYDKALVVEVIMNRVNSPKYPNSIYEVLTQPYQFSGMQSYITLGGFSTQVTESVKAAVDLYLSDPSQFDHGYYSFWGDGYKNHFY